MPVIRDGIADPARDRRVIAPAVVTMALAVLALLSPLSASEHPVTTVGWLLGTAAGIEVLQGRRLASASAHRHATVSAAISMMIALSLINAPLVATAALTIVVAGWFGLDVLRNGIHFFRPRGENRWPAGAAALGNLVVVLLLLFARGWILTWVVTIAGALRIAGIAWNILVAPMTAATEAHEDVIAELGLRDDPEAVSMAEEIDAAQRARAPIDRGWTLSFIAVLLAIHIGRMGTDGTFLGLISPAVAVVGDMLIAVVLTLLVIDPVYLMWRKPTRWVERRAWRGHLKNLRSERITWVDRIRSAWLRWRLGFAIRMRAARFSLLAAVGRGLQVGLPLAAIIAATVPVWGMSWYFDTENWAAGIWNSWAASRTDEWREAMVRAVLTSEGGRATPSSFAITPEGVAAGDFSFIVIGDTGEGDASQHVLRDQILTAANQPGVRFLVISSDVVYPTGAMRDYEAKFWLPFKGVTRPVYAIPGNHDWYDALEAFTATFFQADAAKASIRARVEADLRVTSTTEARIDALVGEAARLRQLYGVPTGFQRAPFFELQTDRFALVAIDTGILRTIDAAEESWLDAALTRADGKMTMAILGHPFYAGGHDVAAGDEGFSRLKQKLLRHGVTVMMAGDTHDLEYYSDPGATPASTVHYFVNGGGGAYLSFGTALAWPSRPPTSEWAHYPGREAVTAKIETVSPWWKQPAWWWTRQFNAWPFSAEWLSAAFDDNVAPFFQSFIEVKVEPSVHRVRLIPYGINGRLTLGDVASSGSFRPAGTTDRTPLEWVVPMK